MNKSVYTDKEVKELMNPNTDRGFWANQKRITSIKLKWAFVGLIGIACILPSLRIDPDDIIQVKNILTMEELGYHQTESLNDPILSPLKYMGDDVGYHYEMNINDPTVKQNDYYNVTLSIKDCDTEHSAQRVFEDDVVFGVNLIKRQYTEARGKVFNCETYEEMIQYFTVLNAEKWNADVVYALHSVDSDEEYQYDNLIFVRKENMIVQLQIPAEMKLTEERINVFSQVFERYKQIKEQIDN